ncbi:MAG TPA: hypothetical protein VNS79_07560 [Sphingobium sp.]|nr:hypothetical protein [Sphingobium sp.]
MKRSIAFAPFLALLLTAPPALAADMATRPPAASIPFANHHGVRDWVAEGDQTIYFQDATRHWYRATLFTRSIDLPFAFAIGLDTGPIGTLDKWSSVIIDGQRYPLQSFERVSGPPGGDKDGR